jgi:aminopeptidase
MPIQTLHIRSKDTDLTITLGEKRKWLSGNGNNIPSFEIFTSPDWRGTEGTIYFDYPLYSHGNIIKDIRFTFKAGRIVKAEAGQNEKLLQELIGQKNANKIGEYSLTDTRFSKINRFMANTLYDENYGGEWGNTHIAVGSSYHEAYAGERSGVTRKEWARLGFNESPAHTDIMATSDRVVEARLKGRARKVIYAKGHFVM